MTEVINTRNPFRTLKTGLFHTDIPAFPEAAFREAILNAVIHRDYLEPGSVYVRHTEREMVISSPGGFIGGITPDNILHAEPRARNRLLAEVFQKIGLVERAGIGRRRIFISSMGAHIARSLVTPVCSRKWSSSSGAWQQRIRPGAIDGSRGALANLGHRMDKLTVRNILRRQHAV
jgi:Putative ATP-dependent DNA helicase recG C-terminal